MTGVKAARENGTSCCPVCNEPLRAGKEPPPRCPFVGSAACPLAPEIKPKTSRPDPLSETVPVFEDTAAVEEDGFPAEDDLAHRTLGQYQLAGMIGRGTMGRVYRAEHSALGRPCAVKVMNPGLVARQPQICERFWAEARAVAQLIHPHVVTVYNLGTDRGYNFIEMEYVPGSVSLRQVLTRDGALEPVHATRLAREVVLALGAAHQSGLVHRDVKPSNVLLTPRGEAKLADFGLVCRLTDRDLEATVAGTPTYMAPELFRGGAASPQSDIYAVGVMLFYLLSARLPFTADHVRELAGLHQRAPVPDVRELVPHLRDELAALVGRCLAKEPAQRPGSADELAAALQEIIGHLRDTEGLLREALEGLNCFIQGARDQFRILFRVPGGRLQEVYVEATPGRLEERLLTVYSVCCPAEPRHYEFALKLNAELTYGGLSIRMVNGQPMFVMTRSFARGLVGAADIRATVQEIARRSDWVELQLTQTDLY